MQESGYKRVHETVDETPEETPDAPDEEDDDQDYVTTKKGRVTSGATREERSEKRKERPGSLFEELQKVNETLEAADRLKKLRTEPQAEPEPAPPPPPQPAAAASSSSSAPQQLPVINIILPPQQTAQTLPNSGYEMPQRVEQGYIPAPPRRRFEVDPGPRFGNASVVSQMQQPMVTNAANPLRVERLNFTPVPQQATADYIRPDAASLVKAGDPLRINPEDLPPPPPPRNRYQAYYDHRLNVLLDPDQYYARQNAEARALRFTRPGAPTIPMAAPPPDSPFVPYTISNAQAYGPTSQRTIDRWNPASLRLLTPEQREQVRAQHARDVRANDAAPAIYTVLTPEEIRRTETARRRYDQYRQAEQAAERTRAAVRANQAMPFRDPIRIRALQAVTQSAGNDFQRIIREDMNLTAWRAGELAPFPPSSLPRQ